MAKKENRHAELVSASANIEAPYELPEGWKWCRLMDCASVISKGTTPKGGKDAYLKEGVNFLRIENLNDDGAINLSNISHISVEEHEGNLKRSILKEGDLLISIAGTLGKVGFVTKADLPMNTNQAIAFVRLHKDIFDNKYLKYAIESPFVNAELLTKTKVTSIPNLTLEIISNCLIPLPPTLAEQQRIVNRIETMFAKLDQAQEKAQSVLDSFETRKAAILHKAFTGQLTANWRKENNPEESSEYLDKIKDKVEIRLDFKYWNNPNLPDSWCESTIGNLLYFAGRVGWKGLKAEEYTTEGPILLSVYNLNDGDEVSFNRINHITNERYDESPEIMVRKNDILLTKDGAGIGKLGYIKELPEKATINSSLLLIRPGDVANYKFIYYLLSGPALQNIVKERITGSATPHLFQRDIKEFVLPVPSLPEQQEIVRILDTVLEKESRAKEAAQTVLDQIALLKKSILARAFRGEL